MGLIDELKKGASKFTRESRRAAKYTFALGGAMMGGASGAKAGYEIGSQFDDRKPKLQQSGTDLGKLRLEAQANGFNPLTVLRATGGQGFYKNQIPMGRLSSDAFFNAFDAYEQRNLPAPEITENTMTGKQSVKDVNPAKIADKQFSIKPTEIEQDFVSDGEQIVSNKTIALLRNMILPDGRVVQVPYDPEEGDLGSIATGYGALTMSNWSHHFRIIPKIFNGTMRDSIRSHGAKTQNKADKNTVDILKKLQEQMTIKNTPLLSSAQFDNKLGIKKPIKGLTTRARERQDRINEKMGW